MSAKVKQFAPSFYIKMQKVIYERSPVNGGICFEPTFTGVQPQLNFRNLVKEYHRIVCR